MTDHEFFLSVGGRPVPPEEAAAGVFRGDAEGPAYNFGWLYAPREVEAFLATLPAPTFAQAAPHLAGTGEGQDVFGWEVEQKVLGRLIPSWNQGQIGSCFPAGVPALMADGSRKPVELVAPGDEVVTHLGRARKVVSTFARPYRGEMVGLNVRGVEGPLVCTADHLVRAWAPGTAGAWAEATSLLPTNRVYVRPAGGVMGVAELYAVKKRQERGVFVYDFEVEEDHSFVAGGVVVHNCVSHGWGRTAQDVLLAQVLTGGAEDWPGHEVCREAIYGGSRHQVGKDQCRGDGSVGAWAAKWVRDWGVVLYQKYGALDLTGGYDVPRCKAWGDRGCPQELEPEARLHPVKAVAQVNTPEEGRDAICNLHFVAVCSSLGRTMKRRPGGWCPVQGSWGHCQEERGHCVVKGGRSSPLGGAGAAPYAGDTPAFVRQNSWGDYLGSDNGRVPLASGREVELPQGCYLSTYEESGREYREGDSFSAASATGWARQDVDWTP